MTIQEMQIRAWKRSEANGFHADSEQLNIPTKLMLVVSELSEALEEYRNSTPYSYKIDGKPEGIGPELADVLIRVGDIAQILDINLEREVLNKMDYNDTRSYKHGGKRI